MGLLSVSFEFQKSLRADLSYVLVIREFLQADQVG